MAVTTTAASVATSRALADACDGLGLAARSERDHRHQGVRCREEVEGGHLGAGAIAGVGVDEPHERPDDRQPEGHGVDRGDPAGHRDPPPDDDAGDGQPEEQDLEQPERAEGRRRRCRCGHGRPLATSSFTSSRTVTGLSG